MNAAIHQFIEQSQYHHGSLRELAAMLPADDAELDALIAESVEAGNQKWFVFIVVAALEANRVVQARHLVRGAALMPDRWIFGCAAWHMQGDLAEPLMEAAEKHLPSYDMKTTALLVTAAWCREHRNGVLPGALIPAARTMARHKDINPQLFPFLQALASVTRDDGLSSILEDRGIKTGAAADTSAEVLMKVFRAPVFDRVAARPVNRIDLGVPMRRAVPRINRNSPCHCGSGKKYKNCCIEKDDKRLHQSSPVAGLTQQELAADPERHLTAASMHQARRHEIVRFDPARIPADLLPQYFVRLAAFGHLERAAESFEKLGFSEPLKGAWRYVLDDATRAGRKDIAERLVKLWPDPATVDDNLRPATHLLLAQDDPARYLEYLNDLAMAGLKTEDSQELQECAWAMLQTKVPAVGILAARSMIPITKQKEASFLFEQILETRDKLKLPPDDPFGDILDRRIAEADTDHAKEAGKLQQAQRALNAKAEEVWQLKESLARLQKEIARREAAPPTPATPSAPADESALRELRRKLEETRTELHDRHNERNTLRRDLQKAWTELEELRQSAAPSPPADEAEADAREEDLVLPGETGGNQPLRVIEFPRDFPETLRRVPPSVARGTLTLLGRLAAGEPSAFTNAVRLKACPDILRRRIGIDFRLLFRLLPDRVQVVDLIPRQDLERKIKTLV